MHLEIMVRTLVAGAATTWPLPVKPATAKKSVRQKPWRSRMSTMTINGRVEPLPDDPDSLLIDVVRDALKLTGTKLVCGAGVCGACTVLVDCAPEVSCWMRARAAAGQSAATGRRTGRREPHQRRNPLR